MHFSKGRANLLKTYNFTILTSEGFLCKETGNLNNSRYLAVPAMLCKQQQPRGT